MPGVAKQWYEDVSTWLALALISPVFVWAAGGLIGWSSLSAVKGEVWAAWVQAIGSIAAIAGAVLISRHQTVAASDLEERRQASARNERFESFNQLMDMIETLGRMLDDMVDKTPTLGPELVSTLQDYSAAVRSFKASELPGGPAVHALLVLPRQIDRLEDSWRSLIKEDSFGKPTGTPTSRGIHNELSLIRSSARSAKAACVARIQAG